MTALAQSYVHGASARPLVDFPTTVTGKAQKFIMRGKMIEELGLAVEKTA